MSAPLTDEQKQILLAWRMGMTLEYSHMYPAAPPFWKIVAGADEERLKLVEQLMREDGNFVFRIKSEA